MKCKKIGTDLAPLEDGGRNGADGAVQFDVFSQAERLTRSHWTADVRWTCKSSTADQLPSASFSEINQSRRRVST